MQAANPVRVVKRTNFQALAAADPRERNTGPGAMSALRAGLSKPHPPPARDGGELTLLLRRWNQMRPSVSA